MRERVKVSQMTAILLERARRFGVEDKEIIANMDSNDTSIFKKAESEDYVYKEFFTYAKEQGEDLQTAILAGYQMKYNTQGGLRTWLFNRFGLIPEVDYEAEEGKALNISLALADAKLLYEALAVNWVMLVSDKPADEFFNETKENFKQEVTVDLIFQTLYQK
ncbi:MAG: hypothetical protein ACO1OC_09235 [Tuberibacillus sp.]